MKKPLAAAEAEVARLATRRVSQGASIRKMGLAVQHVLPGDEVITVTAPAHAPHAGSFPGPRTTDTVTNEESLNVRRTL